MTPAASPARRAIVLRRNGCDSSEIERLIQLHGLEIVYTIVTDTGPKLAAIIAVHHLLECDAEVVVIPHITRDEVRKGQPWHVVTSFAELVTAAGVVERSWYEQTDPHAEELFEACPEEETDEQR